MTTPGGPLGRVLTDADGHHLIYERDFDAAPEDVWEAVTDPERSVRWIGQWDGDARVGGTVMFVMTAEGATTPEPVMIEACDPPHTLSVRWETPGEPRWHLDLSLRPHDGGTRLTFVHRNLAATSAPSIGVGWQYYLDRLAVAIAGGDDMPDFAAYEQLQGTYTPEPG